MPYGLAFSLFCHKTKISYNSTSYTQLAGNRYLSSTSETARKKSFNFEVYNNFRILSGLKPLDYNWLTWFIGFTEGDGAILSNNLSKLNKTKSLRFVLTQSHPVKGKG